MVYLTGERSPIPRGWILPSVTGNAYHNGKNKLYLIIPLPQGFLRHVEQCNGSGDCRKSALMGGTMCPSYMATRDEQTTTRARANASGIPDRSGQGEIGQASMLYMIFLICACHARDANRNAHPMWIWQNSKLSSCSIITIKRECRLPVWLIAHIGRIHKINSRFPAVYNALFSNEIISGLVKTCLVLLTERKMPLLSRSVLKNGSNRMVIQMEQFRLLRMKSPKYICSSMNLPISWMLKKGLLQPNC